MSLSETILSPFEKTSTVTFLRGRAEGRSSSTSSLSTVLHCSALIVMVGMTVMVRMDVMVGISVMVGMRVIIGMSVMVGLVAMVGMSVIVGKV